MRWDRALVGVEVCKEKVDEVRIDDQPAVKRVSGLVDGSRGCYRLKLGLMVSSVHEVSHYVDAVVTRNE